MYEDNLTLPDVISVKNELLRGVLSLEQSEVETPSMSNGYEIKLAVIHARRARY
jgi:hypothetical protein